MQANFQRRTLFLLIETIFSVFLDIPARRSSPFQLLETEFSSVTSSRLGYTDFGLVSNRPLLFRAFFLLLESITEIRCKLVFFYFFSSQQWKQFFWLVETDFLSNTIHSDEWKRIFVEVLFSSEQISCQRKPLFKLR